jgi:hypothetical protein
MPKTPTGRRERKKRIRVRENGILDTFTGWAHMSELANGKNQTEGGRNGMESKKI